jgi:rSAM/selenodomain-associated transferase 1
VEHRSVLVFLKLPTPGRVKTRLAATLGDTAAAEIYQRLVERVLANLAASDIDELRVMFDPPSAEREVKQWLASSLEAIAVAVKFVPQCDGDLGDRLRDGFEKAFADGADAAAAIGTDCVAIDGDIFAKCWTQLEGGSDAVYGPTEDGGYYLVAMKENQAALFSSIPWSADDTLARSLQQAEESGLHVETLTAFADVDTEDDWHRARKEFFPDIEAL